MISAKPKKKYHKTKSDADLALGFSLSEQESSFFRRLDKPVPGDWLYSRNEEGRSVQSYKRIMRSGGMTQLPRPNTFDSVLIVPVGKSFMESDMGRFFLPLIKKYAEAFYHPLPVEIFEGFVSLKKANRRENEHEHKQYLVGDIFELINKETSRYQRSYCRLGMTLEDIYPGEGWNFVYGQARLMEKVGVFSFARHSPLFDSGVHVSDLSSGMLTAKQITKLLTYSMKTMVHETAHMFQIKHCIWYQCLMNGNNGEGENAARSFFCCPICLEQIMHTISIGAGRTVSKAERYEQMLSALDFVLDALKTETSIDGDFGAIEKDKLWLQQRLAFLSDGNVFCPECSD